MTPLIHLRLSIEYITEVTSHTGVTFIARYQRTDDGLRFTVTRLQSLADREASVTYDAEHDGTVRLVSSEYTEEFELEEMVNVVNIAAKFASENLEKFADL